MKSAIYIAIAIGSVSPAMATAQSVVWPPMEVEREVTDRQEVRKVSSSFAKCVVKKHPVEAAAIILGDAGNAGVLKAYPKLLDGDCLIAANRSGGGSVQLSLPGAQLRFLLADALVQREFPLNFPVGINLAPPLSHSSRISAMSLAEQKKLSAKNLAARQKLIALDTANTLLAKFGECVVRADPEGSHRLLITAPASVEEKSAINNLQASLGSCLPKGQALRLPISATRGTLAENFYRMAKAAPVATLRVAR